MGALDTLLEVQEHDAALDRLAHRRATLPERIELADLRARMSGLEAERSRAQAERDDLDRRQAQLESHIDASARRIHELESRLYGGTVSASRELSAMAEEVRSLSRRRADLEDQAFAVMEEAEPVTAGLEALGQEQSRLEGRAAQLSQAIAEAEEDIRGEEATQAQARSALAVSLPPALASQYERLRRRLGGVGAAKLVNGACTGCHLALPATERDRIRRLPADALITCEQCGRILVP